MGLCFSAERPEGQEKSQARFTAGLETLLRDADLQQSSRGQSTQNGSSAGHETLLRDPNGVQIPSAKSTFRKTGERKRPGSMERKLCPNPSARKSFDRKLSAPTIRKPVVRAVDGRPLSTTSTRKSFDRRPGSTASTRKSLVGNTLEERKLAEALGLRKVTSEDHVDSSETDHVGWHSLQNLLKENLRDSDPDGRKPIARHSPAKRPQALASPKVHGDDRPRDNGHARMSPGLRSVPGGRKSIDRKSAERKPEERKRVERKPAERKSAGRNSMVQEREDRSPSVEKPVERKPAEWKSAGRNSMAQEREDRSPWVENPVERKPAEWKSASRNSMVQERVERSPSVEKSVERKPAERKSAGGNSMERVDRSPLVERQPVAQRKFVERKSVDRKSLDRTFVDSNFVEIKKPGSERKSFDKKSVDRKSVERVRAPVENAGGAATNLDDKPSVDRVTSFSPGHHSKSLRKPRARNGYFTPENGNPKLLPNARQQQRTGVDPRFKSSFTDIDFLTQKFLIDNSEKAIQARIDASLSAVRQKRQHDQADHSNSSSDFRSARQIDEFTKSCRDSAAKAAARDLDSFKHLTSMDSSDSSGMILTSY